MVFLKTRPFVKWNNAEFTNVSNFTSLLCAAHALHGLAEYFPFPFPPPTIFWSLVTAWTFQAMTFLMLWKIWSQK